MTEFRVHPSAFVEDGATIGAGTSVWHHAQVRSGARIGDECVVGKCVYVGAGVRVGNRCKIQNYALLAEGSVVEDGVFIGPSVVFANDRVPRAINPDGSLKSGEDWRQGTVLVERGASIGAGVIVVPDVRIGRFAMIGAGAVVMSDVPAHALVVGSPARAIGYVCACGARLVWLDGKWWCRDCDRETTGLPEPENT